MPKKNIEFKKKISKENRLFQILGEFLKYLNAF